MTMMIVIYALQFTNVKSSLAENQLLKTHEKHDNFNFPSCFLASNFHSHGQNQLLEFNLFSILRTCLSGHSLKVVGNDVFSFSCNCHVQRATHRTMQGSMLHFVFQGLDMSAWDGWVGGLHMISSEASTSL